LREIKILIFVLSFGKFAHNLVESLVKNGTMTFVSAEIKEHIVNFYKQLYAEQYNWRPKLEGLSVLSIDEDERNWMEREFEESEVLEVVSNFNEDKASRFDEFSMVFFFFQEQYISFQGVS
jgi:hypothetical protein